MLSVLAITILSVTALLSFLKTPVKEVKENEKIILRLWQIDSFEGGVGSRTDFLSKVAINFEKKNKEVFVMVTSHTIESATTMIESGNLPDMISFGAGFNEITNFALKLEKESFTYSNIGDNCFAVPWCRGGYAYFALGESDFMDISSENTLISQSGNGLGECVSVLEDRLGEYNALPSTSAYVKLIDGKYKYILGTQRDVFRFSSRGVSVSVKPVESFNDLYQYIAVTSSAENKIAKCLDFIYYLRSQEVQSQLTKIGLMSCSYQIYSSDNICMCTLEKAQIKNSILAYSSSSSIEEMRSLSKSAIRGDLTALKNLKKYLL